MIANLLLVFAPSLAVAANSTCGTIKDAYKSSMCCGADTTKTSNFAVTVPSANVSYTYATNVKLSAGSTIKPYYKIKSATCGYAVLMGAVFSDPTILTEVPQFYSFLDSNYITDTMMTGPEKCSEYCTSAPTCDTFYYQYEWTSSSTMEAASAPPRWMHKCQLNLAYASDCGSPFAADANDWDEYVGRVSASGTVVPPL